VHIITEDVPGAEEFDRRHPNTIHRTDFRRRAWLKPESLFIYAKLLGKSFWLVLLKRVAAVFAGRALPEGLAGFVVARLTGRPVLIYAHGEELTGWGRGRKFRVMCHVLQRADWVLSNSDFTRSILIDLIGVDPRHIAVVYPTVDEERFRPGLPSDDLRLSIGITDKQKLVLSVGRLMERKGFDNVIRTLPTLLEQGLDVHYAIIGIGDYLDYMQNLVNDLGLASRVHFLGHVSYEDLPRWYNACDVFAMPNRDVGGDTEGFGLVFLEAAASGIPSLAGLAGGTGSAVVDGETGYRVDGEQLEEITAGMVRLLSDPAKAARMGENARARVLGNFTHERRVGELRELALSPR
jgi:phosphatidylinositol alpha-1,6-mannosyltransferase